jgi:ferredoxin
MVRTMPQDRIKDEIFGALSSPQWAEVGSRCLACANCTMVCPTCFCTNIVDQMDVSGKLALRTQISDSCFHLDFSYVHGGAHRVSTASRYRQWFSHKFASWFDQFGTSGCVGCGRCITWCPVGIDVTEEMAALRRGGPIPYRSDDRNVDRNDDGGEEGGDDDACG